MNLSCKHILFSFMNIYMLRVCLDSAVTWSAGIPMQALEKHLCLK